MKPEALVGAVSRIAMTHSIDIAAIKYIFLVDEIKSLLPDSGFIKLSNKKNRYLVYIYVRKKTAPVNRWRAEHNILSEWINPDQPRGKKRAGIRLKSTEHPDIISIMQERMAYFGDDAPGITEYGNNRGKKVSVGGPHQRTRQLLDEYQDLVSAMPGHKTGWYASQMGIKYSTLYVILKNWGHLLPKEVDTSPSLY